MFVLYCAPYPAYKAGLAGAPPVNTPASKQDKGRLPLPFQSFIFAESRRLIADF